MLANRDNFLRREGVERGSEFACVIDIARHLLRGFETPVVRNPAKWAAAYDEINRSLRLVNALNLDKQNAILNVLNILAKAASEPPRAGGFAKAE